LEHTYRVGPWLVRPDLNSISNDVETVRLEPKVMAVLSHLAQNAGAVVSKDCLLQAVWPDTFVTDQVLKVSISELRKALGDDAREPRFINTIPKKGYQLIAPVSAAETGGGEARAAAVPRRRLIAFAAVSAALLLLLAAWGVWMRHRAPRRGPINSVAVLPLRNLNGDQPEDFFADGMTEALTTSLSRLGGLRVISRTSTMRYRQTSKTLPEIAGELSVGAVVEGSVAREGERVRVSLRLIEAATDRPLWSQDYERELTDVLDLQSDLARDVARGIRGSLGDGAGPPARARPRVRPEAYEAYLKGRFYWNKRTPEGLRKSIEYYEQALAAQPNFALAYAGLADTHTVLGFYAPSRPQGDYLKAREAALKALSLDDSLAEAHTSLAGVKHKYDTDWSGAAVDFQQAMQLDPGYATARQWYAIYLQSLGRFDEALAELQKAQELDPLSPVMRADRGWILYTARRYDEAISQLREALEFGPSFEATYFLVLAYARKGMYEEALQALGEGEPGQAQTSGHLSLLAHTHALAGRRQAAERILDTLRRRFERGEAAAYDLALVYAALGRKEQALDYLEHIHRERSSWLPFLGVEPELDGLRAEPRFQSLLRQIGPGA
jgi:TolB-like protein/DNA-binding winged helix-turn-helix (wHTH) protein/Tfp pilus assembly protein PilF